MLADINTIACGWWIGVDGRNTTGERKVMLLSHEKKKERKKMKHSAILSQ